jgi:hypothetical protein
MCPLNSPELSLNYVALANKIARTAWGMLRNGTRQTVGFRAASLSKAASRGGIVPDKPIGLKIRAT